MNDTNQQTDNIQAIELIRAGRIEFANGNHKRAHVLWRQAATLRPFDIQIWQALSDVVETDDDRRVCLENIIVINPKDTLATRQLSFLKEKDEEQKQANKPLIYHPRWIKTIFYVGRVLVAFLGILMLFTLGLLIGIAFHLL